MNTVYSYHTFLLPFMWERTRNDLCDIFGSDGDTIWKKVEPFSPSDAVLVDNVVPSEYNICHYYNEPARDLIFPKEEKSLVSVFRVRDDVIRDTKYIITKGNNDYSLDITEISIRIYSTDVAVFILNCANRDNRSISDVKAINEYGRRLSQPFWSDGNYTKCADRLKIIGPKLSFTDDLHSFRNEKVSYSYISGIIREFLNRNGRGIVFRACKAEKDNEIRIITPVDEKMYCSTIIVDESAADKLKGEFNTEDGTFSQDVLPFIAELAFVDTEGSFDRKNPAAYRNRLYESIYTDELMGDNPKLTIVTDQAFIKLMSRADYDVDFSRNVLLHTVVIALVQRLTIARFSSDISRWSDGRISMKEIRSIMNLHQKYVAFENQYMLSEITVKTEGRFIYKSIYRQIETDAALSGVSREMKSLNKLVSNAQGDALNKWGLVLSLIGMEFTLISEFFNADSFSRFDITSYGGARFLCIEGLIAAVIIWFVTRIIFSKND